MIRPARPDDASVLAALSIEVWISTYVKKGVTANFADFVLAEFTAYRIAAAIQDERAHIYVSENTEGLDGYIRVNAGVPSPFQGLGSREIATLYVQHRHQRSGVGRGLVTRAVELHGDGLWLKVNEENERAIEFYRALGFQKVGTYDVVIGHAAYPNDVMVLNP